MKAKKPTPEERKRVEDVERAREQIRKLENMAKAAGFKIRPRVKP